MNWIELPGLKEEEPPRLGGGPRGFVYFTI